MIHTPTVSDQSLSKIAANIDGNKCVQSSISVDDPKPSKCENCGGKRMMSFDRPLCWICSRLLKSVGG